MADAAKLELYSPEWWLERLLKKRSAELPRIASLEKDSRGEQDPPESASAKQKTAWESYSKAARTGWAQLIVNAVANRVRLIGWTCSGGTSDEENQRIETLMRRISAANSLEVYAADLMNWTGSMGRAGVITATRKDGSPLMSIEHPEEVLFEVDKTDTQNILAWIKVSFDDITLRWRATMWTENTLYHFIATTEGSADKQPAVDIKSWQYDRDSENTTLNPLVPFWNKNGQSEFERSISILRRLDSLTLTAMQIIAFQAFRQRAIEAGQKMPTKDENGNAINYDNIFEAAPDSLWMVPPGTKIWESQQADMSGIRDIKNQALKELAATEEMPINVFNPDSAGESAESASLKREGLVFRCEDRIARYRGPWTTVMRNLLTLAGENVADLDIAPVFASPDRVSMSEKADADSKLRETLPLDTRLREIFGYSPEKIEAIKAERSEEILEAATLAAMALPNLNQPQGAGAADGTDA